MPPRLKKSTFPSLDGFPNLLNDEMAMCRAIYVGSLVSDREYYRGSRHGMKVNEFDKIEDPVEREDYKKTCNTLQNTMRTARTQTQNTRNFFNQLGLDISTLTEASLPDIQSKLEHRYRIVYVRYHRASQLCTIKWKGDIVQPRVIFIVSDGEKWDTLTGTTGIFGRFLCSACLETSDSSTAHRCSYTCFSCNSLLAYGNCAGGTKIDCGLCNFTFKSIRCFEAHHTLRTGGSGKTRCDMIKHCLPCGSVYRTCNGQHVCGSIWCPLCSDYKNDNHHCEWKKLSDKEKASLQKKQATFRFAFFDIETSQCPDFAEDEIPKFFSEHIPTTISLCKVCHLCEHSSPDEPCDACGTRKITFQYESVTEEVYKVVDDFRDFLMTDATMKNRIVFSHNGGRFDVHLILKSYLRKGILPKIVNKGTTLIRTEIKTRSGTIVFKDSFAAIPIPLSSFASAFDIPEEKGTFPHLCNSREFWGKTWKGLPPKRYYGYKNMTPVQQARFDLWFEANKHIDFQQDAALRSYCESDTFICMTGCLRYRREMIEATGFDPLTISNTLPAFCLFQLRANFLSNVTMPYIPEAGFAGANQSVEALKYIRWLEHKRGRPLQSAMSAQGERKEKIGPHTYSIDAYDAFDDRATEYEGDYVHGCKKCYLDGTILVGGERAEELRARTMARIEKLRTRFTHVDVVWGCEVKAQLAKNKEMRDFFNDVEVPQRLRIRDALYGGRVEVLRSFLKSTPDTVVKYYDICSMYPSVMSTREFPVGFPEVITENLKPIVDGIFPYRGIARVKVVAPRNLRLAVLPIRYNSALYFGLCFSCIKEKAEHCHHEDEEKRAWVGTYATCELQLALSKNYKIQKIEEVYHFTEWSMDLYRPYFRAYMRMKFCASGFPDSVKTPREQEEYCSKISSKLDLNIRPEDIKYSSSRRVITLRLDASREVKDMRFVTNDILLVTHTPKIETIRANRFSAVHHAVMVTAYARILLYGVVEKAGIRAGYMDTDSVMFEMDRGGEDPLGSLLTGELGELTDEIKEGYEVSEVAIAGCKSYSMEITNLTTGEKSSKLASRGFTKDSSTMMALRHEIVRDMVVNKTPEVVAIGRPELKRKGMAHIYSTYQTKRYRTVSFKRATRGEGECEVKVPFGYIE